MAVTGSAAQSIGTTSHITAGGDRIVDDDGAFVVASFGSTFTLSAAGDTQPATFPTVVGSVDATLENFTLAAQAGPPILGTSDVTLDNITLSATAVVPIVCIDKPQLLGLGQFGSVLSTTLGRWSSALPITFEYQFRRNGLNISGATGNSYTVKNVDAGTIITCRVTAINALGANAQITNGVTINSLPHRRRSRFLKAIRMIFGGHMIYNWTNEE